MRASCNSRSQFHPTRPTMEEDHFWGRELLLHTLLSGCVDGVQARREKIDERMKCLQGLVPGCNEIMGKARVLDEIINYVQSLQSQIEFLSLKLAAANPGMHCISSEVLELNSSCYSRNIEGISLPAINDQLELLQPASDFSGLHMSMNPQITWLRNTISTVPNQLHSCFNVIASTPSIKDINIYEKPQVLGSSAWDETCMNGFPGLESDRGKDSELEKGKTEKLKVFSNLQYLHTCSIN
ncbi:hypothetical protein ZIOFF_062798 [Zingiber officinale]|uniref:BHLH domain-containing protein n=1 Tax=Zingiber officinale TaxID=94328 RepID=A0A8J5K9H2_ZINOF|nr:hypothetical protein ZIOFF_062798 [Zingiber officinale]